MANDFIGSRIVQGGENGSAAYVTLPSFYRKMANVGPKTEMGFEIRGDSIIFTPIKKSENTTSKDGNENGGVVGESGQDHKES